MATANLHCKTTLVKFTNLIHALVEKNMYIRHLIHLMKKQILWTHCLKGTLCKAISVMPYDSLKKNFSGLWCTNISRTDLIGQAKFDIKAGISSGEGNTGSPHWITSANVDWLYSLKNSCYAAIASFPANADHSINGEACPKIISNIQHTQNACRTIIKSCHAAFGQVTRGCMSKGHIQHAEKRDGHKSLISYM